LFIIIGLFFFVLCLVEVSATLQCSLVCLSSCSIISIYANIFYIDGAPCPDLTQICSKNGRCVGEFDGSKLEYSCVCNSGYVGNGTTCVGM